MKLEFFKKGSKKLIQNNQIYGGGKKLPYTKITLYLLEVKKTIFLKSKMRQKENYVITLPDCKTFTAIYERVSRDRLPPNITIWRRHKQGAAPKHRRRHVGRGLPGAFSSIPKIVRSSLFRTLRTVA